VIGGVGSLLAIGVVTGGASADLYGVGRADLDVSMYYVVSTSDASVALVSQNPDVEAMAGIGLAPGGGYAAMTLVLGSLYIVDPETGDAMYVANPYGYMLPSGGPAVDAAGIAYIGGWHPFDYTRIFTYDLATGEKGREIWLDYEVPPLTAMLVTPEGDLIGAAGRDVMEIDVVTGEVSLIGTLDPSHGQFIYSFAHDPWTGVDYVLTGQDLVRRLYEIDFDSLETTLIGTLAEEARIVGIAGIACAADFNGDGALNVLDFVAFQVAWQAGDERADVNGDGVLDVLDFVAFQGVFAEGC